MSSLETAPAVDVERFVRLTDVSLDEAYALLTNPRTRLTLHVLSSCGPPLPVSKLIDIVCSRDDGDTYDVRVSLVHVILPKLESHGILEYDRDAGLVYLDRPVVAVDTPITELRDDSDSPGTNSSPT
ncbi:DUF7344 domain-containing protein [Natrinema halophilum]|uniref:DUF7344 domain-containing protein n=1 Tax=Natrinema halophilum TaxID=1699371 RepID=A0A7D5KD94_9EURY|nr:hypothetical protein [Natrinema halophilum]QLG49236.1 hypothetical protein HYG82_10390 [Natrinema halophilum]